MTCVKCGKEFESEKENLLKGELTGCFIIVCDNCFRKKLGIPSGWLSFDSQSDATNRISD